jgi:hypothetical protein
MRTRINQIGIVALLVALIAVLSGCNKVAGGGKFVADNSFGAPTAGDTCTFGFNAQPVGNDGRAKGQIEFVDHTFQGVGLRIHATLNVTESSPDRGSAAYQGEGTATVTFRGQVLTGLNLLVIAIDGDPDYVIMVLGGVPALIWSGPVDKGTITVH